MSSACVGKFNYGMKHGENIYCGTKVKKKILCNGNLQWFAAAADEILNNEEETIQFW